MEGQCKYLLQNSSKFCGYDSLKWIFFISIPDFTSLKEEGLDVIA